MCPRKYDASRRRAAVEATRNGILEAARSLVGGKGDLVRFSMEAVAQKSGVSRMTVYYQFRSRAGLLEALADHLAARGGMDRMGEVFRARDPEVAVRRLVESFTGFWASDRTTMRRMRAMGVVFPTRSAGPRNRDAWRREAVANLLARHGVGGPPGKSPPPNDLVDLLTSLTSFETFDALCADGRSPEAATALIAGAALLLLHGPRVAKWK
ncbi:MAG: TetR/AcrR family transcriptional regulator [Thermoplasmata archaeon]